MREKSARHGDNKRKYKMHDLFATIARRHDRIEDDSYSYNNEVSSGPPVGLRLWVTRSPTVIQFKNKTDVTGVAC